MSESLWNCTAAELLRRASSGEPTPGGGSVAALAAAFGFGLALMSIEVTLAAPELEARERELLLAGRERLHALQGEAVSVVDRDVSEFDAVMAGYRLPRDTDDERAARRAAIDDATLIATRGPLGLAEAALTGIELVNEIEPLIRRSIVSDAQAGRDLLLGAALAALRTADINLVALEQSGHDEAAALRARRENVADAATATKEPGCRPS